MIKWSPYCPFKLFFSSQVHVPASLFAGVFCTQPYKDKDLFFFYKRILKSPTRVTFVFRTANSEHLLEL